MGAYDSEKQSHESENKIHQTYLASSSINVEIWAIFSS